MATLTKNGKSGTNGTNGIDGGAPGATIDTSDLQAAVVAAEQELEHLVAERRALATTAAEAKQRLATVTDEDEAIRHMAAQRVAENKLGDVERRIATATAAVHQARNNVVNVQLERMAAVLTGKRAELAALVWQLYGLAQEYDAIEMDRYTQNAKLKGGSFFIHYDDTGRAVLGAMQNLLASTFGAVQQVHGVTGAVSFLPSK